MNTIKDPLIEDCTEGKRVSPQQEDNSKSSSASTFTPKPKAKKPVVSKPPYHFLRTDAGNAELFAALYQNKLRYNHKRKKWLVWRRHWWPSK